MIRAAFGKSVLSALALAAFPALADEGPPPKPTRDKPPVIGFFDASAPHCYLRIYDASHMAAHPKQKVTGIAFAYVPEMRFEGEPEPQPMWDQWSEQPGISASIVVTITGESRTAMGSAYCGAGSSSDQLDCGMEGDGGRFTLTRVSDGKYRIDNAVGFAVEFPAKNEDDPNDGFFMIDPRDDHEAFLLGDGTRGLCDAKWQVE